MARTTADSGAGDWTAGLIAIAAALLIGAAAPVAIYYALYLPRVEVSAAERVKLADQESRQSVLHKGQAEVKGFEADIAKLKSRLSAAEGVFTPPDLVPKLVKRLSDLAASYNILLRQDRRQMIGAKVVYEEGAPFIFPDGLRGTRVVVVGQAPYHDLCRFVCDVESQSSGMNRAAAGGAAPPAGDPEAEARDREAEMLKQAVVIIESLNIQGDQNGGYAHNFQMTLYVIERRNVDEVGTR